MSDPSTHLYVPTKGPVAVLTEGDPLERMSEQSEQEWLVMNIETNGNRICQMVRGVDPLSPINSRAAQVFLDLTALHMIFTGPVLFGYLETGLCMDLVRREF